MRLDRFASVYLFHPFVHRRDGTGLRIPILMYHAISKTIETRGAYFQTTTTPARFREQMEYLSRQGYSTISLSQALEHLTGMPLRVSKPVVVTFDDGFQDFYRHAFPVLAHLGFTASMYLPTAYIQDTTTAFQGTDCMTWREVRELDSAGIEFGSHTVTHPKLTELTFDAIERELRDSRETIENQLGHTIQTFAYPFAFPETNPIFVSKFRDTLRRCNYAGGVCTAIGTATVTEDRYFLPRLPVNSADDLSLFQAKLDGAYDWLRGLQRLKKTITARS